MLKFAILLFNTFALLIYQFLFTEGVTVTQSVPKSAKAESEFTVELTIKKGATVGFAKLQQELPAGFSAVEDKNNGASFTFSNQMVKFIWMSLPNDPEFKVSYKVKVAAGTSGDQTIAGKFSYVTDNAKQTTEIEPAIVTIGDGGDASASSETPKTETPKTETTTTEATTTETPTTETSTTETTTTTKTPVSTESSPFTCVRKVPGSASGEFTVEITVNKANLTGFAKLIEVLPSGFTATAVESSGASFSFADQKVRYIWVSLPTQPEFTISYKVKPGSASGDQIIDGVFSYIENDETKKFVLQTSTITISGGGDETPLAVKEEPVKEETTEKTLTATSIPSPQGSIIYHVQILALRNAKTASEVADLYNISSASINPVMEEGFRKYLVGSHGEYKEARNAREPFKSKALALKTSPFVTAYNKGKRITVQEALMISNQKWYR